MPGITPVYGWPFQALLDPPNGAKLGEDLAIAIENTVSGQAAVNASVAARLTILETLVASMGDFQPWTPTLGGGLVVGTGVGSLVTEYTIIQDIVLWYLKLMLGTGGNIGTGPTFTLPPVTPTTEFLTQFSELGYGTLIDAATNHYPCAARINSGTTCEIVAYRSDLAAVQPLGVSPTSPFTWVAGDAVLMQGWYKRTP